MSQRSPDRLRRGIVANDAAPLADRLSALKQVKPTRRFLQRLLKATDEAVPQRLKAEASKMLLNLPARKVKAAKPSLTAKPSLGVPTFEPVISETGSEKPETPAEGLAGSLGANGVLGNGVLTGIIDPSLFDILAGPDGKVPGCVKGSDPVTPTPLSPSDSKSSAHVWRKN
jgi:hypothetical protein